MKQSKLISLAFFVFLSSLLILFFSLGAQAKSDISPPIKINTVLGQISPDKLGTTLVHEHFSFAYPGWFADESIAPYDYKKALKINIAAIKKAKKYGVRTIIDATTNDVGGRNPLLYKELAQKTGVNIICSTGLYTEHEGSPAYWKTRVVWGADISKMMTELFIKEITQGIGTTRVKAGVIKCGTSGGGPISAYETAVLKAAAAAQKATGVPIITHTDGPAGGVEQADIFIAEGVNPKRVMIGHVSNSRDIEYHKAILSRGVYVAFDRIGLEVITPTDVNIKNIVELCKLGYANQIMLSHDTVNFWLGRPISVPDQYLPAFANWRMDFISEKVVPALKAQGVTDQQIKAMMVDNPKNLFLGR